MTFRNYFYSLMTDEAKDPLSFFLKGILWVLSYQYLWALAVGEFLRGIGLLKERKIPLPVVSVGNLTVGGTGKTPFVKWMARRFLSQGKKVAILTRGYRRVKETISDESAELQNSLPGLPVWVGRDRVSSAERAVSSGMDAVILDDGFQHRRLARDLDIVLLDATRPFGNGKTLPRGILRESPSALRRADLLVITRADAEAKIDDLTRFLKKEAPLVPILTARHHLKRFYEARTKKEVSPEIVKKGKSLSFCGIGNPEAFSRLLEASGIRPLKRIDWMDHYRYTKQDIEKMDREAKKIGAEFLLTTEKDAARLDLLGFSPATELVVAEIEMVITQNEEELLSRLDTLFSR